LPKTHRAGEPAFRQQAIDLLLQSGRLLDTAAEIRRHHRALDSLSPAQSEPNNP
jgi:hypothetical protein